MATNDHVRTTGISNGVVDTELKEARFTLDTENWPIKLTMNFGAAQQTLSALASMAATLRESLNQPGATYSSATETVAEANVAIERFDRLVMLLLVTDKGIPHTFALTPDGAEQISARLRKETKRFRSQPRGRA